MFATTLPTRETYAMNVIQMFDLSGEVAVITGAGNGLGYQIAEAMAEAGADVVCADIDMDTNEIAAQRVQSLGCKALSVRCDVTREADVASLFQLVDKTFGRVDIAFANAGFADKVPQPLHDYPTDSWNTVLAVNLQGVFYYRPRGVEDHGASGAESSSTSRRCGDWPVRPASRRYLPTTQPRAPW